MTLRLRESVCFEASNERGNTVIIDGPETMGGKNLGCRPMQVFLSSLAACAAMDVAHILNKGKSDLVDLKVEAEGIRSETIPAIFTEIRLTFSAKGNFSLEKLERAVSLSIEKYCSVAAMLGPQTSLLYDSRLMVT